LKASDKHKVSHKQAR